jgi:hypothetical protein
VFLAKCKDNAKGSEHVLTLKYHTVNVNAYERLE